MSMHAHVIIGFVIFGSTIEVWNVLGAYTWVDAQVFCFFCGLGGNGGLSLIYSESGSVLVWKNSASVYYRIIYIQ